MASFPAVATVIGISQEVAESGPLLATIAIDPSLVTTQEPPAEPVDIKTGDPVSQAVVDNIIGKLPTKKEVVFYKCEVCNVSVSSPEILQIHYGGAKHNRKVKGQELVKEIINSPNSLYVMTSAQGENVLSDFGCKICKLKLNSYQQLQQHLTGTKHKNKAQANQINIMKISIPNGSSEEKDEVAVDIGPNRLYCAACDVRLNSDLQLHQHITSNKHANKVNGPTRGPGANNNRGSPYTRRPARGGMSAGSWNVERDVSRRVSWSPNSCGFGLMGPSKNFVSGGLLNN